MSLPRGFRAQEVWLGRGRNLWCDVQSRSSFSTRPQPATDYTRSSSSNNTSSTTSTVPFPYAAYTHYKYPNAKSKSSSSSFYQTRVSPSSSSTTTSTFPVASSSPSPVASSPSPPALSSPSSSNTYQRPQSQRSRFKGTILTPAIKPVSPALPPYSPFRGKPYISLPIAPTLSSATTHTTHTTSSIAASSSITSTSSLSFPSSSSIASTSTTLNSGTLSQSAPLSSSPFRSRPYQRPRILPHSQTSSSSSSSTSTPIVFVTPKNSNSGAPADSAPHSNLTLALINALAQPPAPKPSLSSYRSTPARRMVESENQRLYEFEQKKLREKEANNPPVTPMKAWFAGAASPAATRSPLHGAEVTSVHTAGDITRWKADYRSTFSGRVLNPETPAEARVSMMRIAKKKEKFLEQSWHDWLNSHGGNEEQPQQTPKRHTELTSQKQHEITVQLSRRTRIQSFSKLTGIATRSIIDCVKRSGLSREEGKEVTSNTILDMAAQEYLCIEFGRVPVMPQLRDVEKESTEKGEPRSPVVCIMGHVDHGKTSLLDRLRSTNVVSGEAGGITQSIGAFTVASGAVFLDTPGHAAFSAMRARGADKNMTDIVVLVVACDSGVQPQTIEAIELAQANQIPIIVAITKCDLDVDESPLRRQLLRHGLQDEEAGGETLFVRVSAKTGMGMEELVSSIGLAAEMLDLKAPIQAPARACVLECSQQQGLGCVVNVVLRSGTISVGDIVVCGTECVKVRALIDERGQKRQSCGPSTPVSVVGFKDLDAMGTILRGVASEEEGKAIISEREASKQELQFEKGLENSLEQDGDHPHTLRAIIKASTKGSLEAFMKYVSALPQDRAKIIVLKSSVGPIHEGDVQMAGLLGAKLFGFGLNLSEAVADTARKKGVTVHTREIIYQLMDDFRDAVAMSLPPVVKEEVLGTAQVLQVFKRDGKKKQTINAAGCRVVSGKLVSRDPKGKIQYRVKREGAETAQSGLERLFHFKDEVQSIDKGQECCLVLQDVNEYEPGDTIECISISQVPPMFDDSAGRAS